MRLDDGRDVTLTPEQQAEFMRQYGQIPGVKVFDRMGANASSNMATDLAVQGGPQRVQGIGNETWDEIAGRYQRRGADLQTRGAPTLDQRQADQSRGLQMNALEMLRRQGAGEAPSAAGALAGRANEQAVMGAGQYVTGAKAPGGALAALRHAGQNAGQQALAGNAQNAAARAGEISQGQQGFAGGAAGVRAGDIGAATQNAQLEAQQRALNERSQQAYEGMGQGVRTAELGAGAQAQATHDANVAALNRIRSGQKQAERDALLTGGSLALGAATSGASLAAQGAAKKIPGRP